MKRLFFAIALLVTTLSANAQYDPGTWSMQIKYGLGASMFSGMDREQRENEGPQVQT